jgi:hypothetical protein
MDLRLPPYLPNGFFLQVGWVGKFLMDLASKVILGSESSGTHDHILLSHDSRSRATLPDLPLGIPTKMLYAFLVSSMRVIFTIHLNFLIY